MKKKEKKMKAMIKRNKDFMWKECGEGNFEMLIRKH